MCRDVSEDTWTCLAILCGYLYSYNMSVADGCVLGLAACLFTHGLLLLLLLLLVLLLFLLFYCYYHYY